MVRLDTRSETRRWLLLLGGVQVLDFGLCARDLQIQPSLRATSNWQANIARITTEASSFVVGHVFTCSDQYSQSSE